MNSEQNVEMLVEKLGDILDDVKFESLKDNISKAIKGFDNEIIGKAFCNVTGGQFIDSKVCVGNKILTEFPHIIYDMKLKKYKCPHITNKSFVINIDGTKTMHYLVAEEFLGYKKILGENKNSVKFKDGNNLNYDVKNLLVPKQKLVNTNVSVCINEDNKNEETVNIPMKDPLKFNLKWDDIKDGGIDIRDEEVTIRTLRDRAPYDLKNIEGQKKLIKDMRSVFGCTNSTSLTYIFKDKVFDEESEKEYFKIIYTSRETAASKLSLIEIGSYSKLTSKGYIEESVNAWEIYIKNNHLFAYDYVRFYDENDDTRAFTYFKGYKWKELDEVDEELIKLYLDHIKIVIANGNSDVYNYILKWFASIIQKPNRKMRTALVVLGKQRTGKNVFTNALCNLLLGYSTHSETNMEHICGKFNSGVLGKKLIIGNELQSVDANKYVNSERMKSVITEKNIEIERKGKDVISGTNVANFI